MKCKSMRIGEEFMLMPWLVLKLKMLESRALKIWLLCMSESDDFVCLKCKIDYSAMSLAMCSQLFSMGDLIVS